MAQIDIDLPTGLKGWVDQCVADGSYVTASDYICDLIRRDQRNNAEVAELQAMIDLGQASGIDPRDPSHVIKAIISKHAASS